jgi:hypothetical protein
MADSVVSEGTSDIVNLLENRNCCLCGKMVSKRKPMWKFSDGNYMCIPCKTILDTETSVKSARKEIDERREADC